MLSSARKVVTCSAHHCRSCVPCQPVTAAFSTHSVLGKDGRSWDYIDATSHEDTGCRTTKVNAAAPTTTTTTTATITAAAAATKDNGASKLGSGSTADGTDPGQASAANGSVEDGTISPKMA
ncbi:hypothetical protein EV182_003996, partial [Spiromyces aspiralis]